MFWAKTKISSLFQKNLIEPRRQHLRWIASEECNRLAATIQERRSWKHLILKHDNITKTVILDLSWEIWFSHPPHPPDLGPSDFRLFRPLLNTFEESSSSFFKIGLAHCSLLNHTKIDSVNSSLPNHRTSSEVE